MVFIKSSVLHYDAAGDYKQANWYVCFTFTLYYKVIVIEIERGDSKNAVTHPLGKPFLSSSLS